MPTIEMRFRGLLAGAALAAALMTYGSATSAMTTVVTKVGLGDNYLAKLTDSRFPLGESVHLTPLVFDGSKYVFCVDPYHNITLGAVHYVFNSYSLSTNSDGVTTGTGAALTGTQVGEIGALVSLGFSDLSHHDFIGATAVQGAIWDILGATVTAGVGSPAGLALDISEDLTYASNPAVQRQIGAIYDKVDNVQGFAAVPETSVWLMLIAGVGQVGAVMRRRRAAAPPTDRAASSIA